MRNLTVTVGSRRVRVQRLLREAEGYLELKMPQQALQTLARIDDPGTFRSQTLYLRGQALQMMQLYEEAIEALEGAADLSPSNTEIVLALAWCYRRAGRMPSAIATLEQALLIEPDNAQLLYHLARDFSLCGKRRRTLDLLAMALERDSQYRELIATEPDFDPLRGDPEFQALTAIIV